MENTFSIHKYRRLFLQGGKMSDKHLDETEELFAETEQKISADEEKLLDDLGIFGDSRRKFLGQVSSAGLGILAFQILAEQDAFAAADFIPGNVSPAPVSIENAIKVVIESQRR